MVPILLKKDPETKLLSAFPWLGPPPSERCRKCRCRHLQHHLQRLKTGALGRATCMVGTIGDHYRRTEGWHMPRAALLFSTWRHGSLFLRSLEFQWGLTGLDFDIEEAHDSG